LKILGSPPLRTKKVRKACPLDMSLPDTAVQPFHTDIVIQQLYAGERTAEEADGTPPTPDLIQQAGKLEICMRLISRWAHSQKKAKSGSRFAKSSAEWPTSLHRKYLHPVDTTTSNPQHQNLELQSQNSRQYIRKTQEKNTDTTAREQPTNQLLHTIYGNIYVTLFFPWGCKPTRPNCAKLRRFSMT